MLPSISVDTGRRTQTQSSVRPSVGQDSKWKSASITNRNRGREANTRGEETKKNLYPALLRSASGELLPLDKDLSWKSANQTFQAAVDLYDYSVRDAEGEADYTHGVNHTILPTKRVVLLAIAIAVSPWIPLRHKSHLQV